MLSPNPLLWDGRPDSFDFILPKAIRAAEEKKKYCMTGYALNDQLRS
jgi:hypothetical protein